MGRKLHSIEVEKGIFMTEKACENYKCRSCGARMISVNFVNGLCVQVFASHGRECAFAEGNPAERTLEVDCSTCKYFSEGNGCEYSGRIDGRISAMRTAAV